MAQAAARQMSSRGGSIINSASIIGLRVACQVSAYATSKAGIVQLTKALALEWARYQIRDNALCPGYLETPFNKEFLESEAGPALIRRIPQRRLGQLSDLDAPLLLLASDASAYMTGSVLVVDGGHSVSSLHDYLDFTISPEIDVLRDRIARFVDQDVLPVEADRSTWDQHENIGYGALQILRRKARQKGLWCLQLSLEAGGLGLSKVGMAVCCEAMNRSIFGPVVFNSAAPDDGNMMVLEKLGTAEQKSRWLARIELFAETPQSQTIIGEAEVFLE